MKKFILFCTCAIFASASASSSMEQIEEASRKRMANVLELLKMKNGNTKQEHFGGFGSSNLQNSQRQNIPKEESKVTEHHFSMIFFKSPQASVASANGVEDMPQFPMPMPMPQPLAKSLLFMILFKKPEVSPEAQASALTKETQKQKQKFLNKKHSKFEKMAKILPEKKRKVEFVKNKPQTPKRFVQNFPQIQTKGQHLLGQPMEYPHGQAHLPSQILKNTWGLPTPQNWPELPSSQDIVSGHENMYDEYDTEALRLPRSKTRQDQYFYDHY